MKPNHHTLDAIQVVLDAVDRRAKEVEALYGIGVAQARASVDTALRFREQRLRFSRAVLDYDATRAKLHGEAVLRGFDALVAEAGEPTKPEQWEFTVGVDEELIILVRDIADTGRVDTGGRQCQVWSLDEIASVIRNHPAIVAAKTVFPGAVVESVRPDRAARSALNDALSDVPFTLAG